MGWLSRLFPRSSARRLTRTYKPRLETLEDRTVLTFQYFGGPLLAHVQIQSLYYGSQWATDPTLTPLMGKLDGYLSYIVNSPFMDQLNIYNVYRGSFTPGVIDSSALPSTVDDSQIQVDLANDINSNLVVNPGGVNNDRLYFIYVEPGVVITQGGGNSVNDFLGYHNATQASVNGQVDNVYYAVIPYHAAPNAFVDGLPYEPFDSFGFVSAHELGEAVTDPIPGAGWYDDTNPNPGLQGEVGDTVDAYYGYNYGGVGTSTQLGEYLVQRISDIQDQPLTIKTSAEPVGVFLSLSNSTISVESSVTLTAEVTEALTGEPFAPTGTVDFYADNNPVPLGTAPLQNVGGIETANLNVVNLTGGTHQISAVYQGNVLYHSRTTYLPTPITVNQGQSTTVVAISPANVHLNQPITFTATVSGNPNGAVAPTGMVDFYDGVTLLGSSPLQTVKGSQQATFTTSTLSAGDHSITANYDGDTSFVTSQSAPVTATIISNPTVATLTSGSVNSVFNTAAQTIMLSGSVTNAASIVANGNITFSLLQGSTVIGTPVTASVDTNGKASVIYTLPPGLPSGSYTIEAAYADPTLFFDSSSDSSNTLTVTSAQSTVGVASNVNATYSTTAQTVSLSATASSSTVGVNEGAVTFSILNSNNKVVGTAVSASVNSSGVATATYALPAGLVNGTYTIQANYHDATGDYADASDTTKTLTVTAAPTVVLDTGSISTIYSTSGQNVYFRAGVTSGGTVLPTGSITFTLLDANNNVIGTPVSLPVDSNGQALAMYTLPSGQTSGTYTIQTVYHDSKGNYADSTDLSHTLVINPANSLVAQSGNLNISYSPTAQVVTLTARIVNAGANPIPEGSITFSVINNSNQPIGSPITANVDSNGSASVLYTIPAGQQVSVYPVRAVYQDSLGNYVNSTDASHALTINSATSSVAVKTPAAVAFSSVSQTVSLTATATGAGGTPLTEGTITFRILDSKNTLVGIATGGNVNSSGAATVAYPLPAALASGTYSIQAVYHDSLRNFGDSSDSTQRLTLTGAVTSVATSSNLTATYSQANQNVTISATALSNSNPAAEGSVTFTVLDSKNNVVGTAVSAPVNASGQASVTYVVPGSQTQGTYTIKLAYHDTLGNYGDSTDTSHTLAVGSATSSLALSGNVSARL